MFIRNVYSEAEQKALKKWKERSESLVGWIGDMPSEDFPYPVRFRSVVKEVIEHHSYTVDFKNPLYRDENYARKTRWGGIIAPPFFVKSICSSGPFHWLPMPSEVGKLDSISIGEGFEFFFPVRPGDSFRVYCCPATIEDITEDGEQPLRKYRIREEIKYYNQKEELVCIAYRNNTCAFAAPDAEYGKVLRMGYEMANLFGGMADLGEIQQTEEYKYDPEDIKAIDNVYSNEERRGSKIRYWEDVNIGEELPPIVMGPITTWDATAYMATFGVVPMPMMEIRKRTPHEVVIDPETNIPHKTIELHLGPKVAKLVGFYSPTIIETIIQSFFGRLASNWMGDDGFLKRFEWCKMANTNFGDSIFGRGKVLRKYIDNEGNCLVDIDAWMETQRGYISNAGPFTVSLQSKEMLSTGKLPDLPQQPVLNLNPQDIKTGDRVRIKPRPDWELPSGYGLANEPATVFDQFDVDGYAFLLLDNDVTGIDPRVPLGFRLEALEKI